MLPSDQLESHEAHFGFVDDPIQPHTQSSSQILHIPFTLSIGIDSRSNVGVKNTSVSLSSSLSLPSSKSLLSSPLPSSMPLSSPLPASSAPLELHQKRQRVQKYSDADADADIVTIYDEANSLQQMTTGVKTATQPRVLPMAENVKDNAMEKIIQAMEIMRQQMGTLEQMIQVIQNNHTNTTNTTSSVMDASHTETTATTQDMFPQDKKGDNLPSQLAPSPSAGPSAFHVTPNPATAAAGTAPATAAVADDDDDDDDNNKDDDGHNNTIDAMSPSLPLSVVIHHGTRQFNIPPLIPPPTITLFTAPPTIKPPKKYYPHSRMDVDGKYAIVPSMMLCVLANNPDIMLPLASFQTCLFDHMHVLNQESFHLSCKPMSYFDSMTKVITSVVSNRIRSALNTLYPKAGLYEDDSNDDELKAMALELEKGPVDVLESIVRDAMAVWNPIRVLITHLEAVTMHYSKCTTGDEREALRQHIATGHDWMRHTANMALVYGLYMWDSQWVSDDEWDTLVKHMTTLTTQIFPEAYKSLLKMNSGPRSTLTNDDHDIIDYFRYILGIVSCCFLHQYRPVQRPISIPHCSLINTDTHWYTIPKSVYETALTSSITLLKQCVSEYMDNPPAFPQFSSMENLLLHSTTTTDDYASSRDYIMSKIELACNSHATHLSSTHKGRDGRTLVCWNSRVPMYYGNYISHSFRLTYRILHAPPHNDPAYRRIAKIYPSQFHRSSLLGDHNYPGIGPEFQKTPSSVNRTRDGSTPQQLSQEEELKELSGVLTLASEQSKLLIQFWP